MKCGQSSQKGIKTCRLVKIEERKLIAKGKEQFKILTWKLLPSSIVCNFVIDLFSFSLGYSLSLSQRLPINKEQKNWIPFDTVTFFYLFALGLGASPCFAVSFSYLLFSLAYFYALITHSFFSFIVWPLDMVAFRVVVIFFLLRHFDQMILILCNFILNWQLVCRIFKQLNFLDLCVWPPVCFPLHQFSGRFLLLLFFSSGLSKQNVHTQTHSKWAKGPLDITF